MASSESSDRSHVFEQLAPLYQQVERVIVGQRLLIDRILIALLTNGHLLIEGVPGLAKTLTIRTFARTLNLQAQRIQFTPDLLPADLIGTQIYQPASGEFRVRKGPVFANIVLADEINRAPAKVQSALLEAMEERQVTIGEQTFPLPEPFIVLATQNPIEQEGTYPLPEAQLDRFMLKVVLDYPSKAEERLILDRMGAVEQQIEVGAVLQAEELRQFRHQVDQVHVDERIIDYLLDIVQATRRPEEYRLNIAPLIQFGASPRATIALLRASRASALLAGRAFVTPQDVKLLAADVLRHRLVLSYEAEAEERSALDLIQEILDTLEVP